MHGNRLHQMDSFAGYNPFIKEKKIQKAEDVRNNFLTAVFLYHSKETLSVR